MIKLVIHDAVPLVALQKVPRKMPDLPDDQCILLHRLDLPAESLPESVVDLVRNVQAPPVNIAFPDPVRCHIDDKIRRLPVLQIQLRHHRGIAERLIVRLLPPLHHQRKVADIIPVQIVRLLFLFHHVLKRKEIHPRVVEHAVQNDVHPERMRLFGQLLQVRLGAKRRVDLIIVVNIVLMAGTRTEYRRHVDHIHAQIFYVIQMIDDPAQRTFQICLMTDRSLIPLLLGNLLVRGKTGRKDLVDNLVLRPLRKLEQLLLPKILRTVKHPVDVRDALVEKVVIAVESDLSRSVLYLKKIPEADHIHIQLCLIIINVIV